MRADVVTGLFVDIWVFIALAEGKVGNGSDSAIRASPTLVGFISDSRHFRSWSVRLEGARSGRHDAVKTLTVGTSPIPAYSGGGPIVQQMDGPRLVLRANAKDGCILNAKISS